MSDVVSFTEIYGQHVELLPGRTTLQAGGSADPTTVDVPDDGGPDGGAASRLDGGAVPGVNNIFVYVPPTTTDVAGVDDDGPGGRPDDGGTDSDGGVDDDGPGGRPDDGGDDGDGDVDDDGDENGDGVR